MNDPDPDSSRRVFLRGLMLGGMALGLGLSLPDAALAAQTRTGRKRFPLQKREPPRKRVLMIDPGHGGHDPGAIGKNGTYEKDVTLDIARRLAKAINAQGIIDAKLTRDMDMFLPLGERVDRGRDAKADFFVSIHADSAPNAEASGLSVYTLSEKGTDEFSRKLAQQENLADRIAGVDLASTDADVAAILVDLAARRSRDIAMQVKSELVTGVGSDLNLLRNPMRAANFAVLRAPDVPSMLIETGFLSNSRDEALLRLPVHRQKVAQVLGRELGRLLTHMNG